MDAMTPDRCPVCWRSIPLDDESRMTRHRDKAGNACPMSGQDASDLDPIESLPRKEAANHAQ